MTNRRTILQLIPHDTKCMTNENTWSDYGIFAVRYNATYTQIETVKVYRDHEGMYMGGEELTRRQLADALTKGKTFITTFMKQDGTWQKGKPVHKDARGFIRTVADGRGGDMLEGLPEY